MNEWMNIIAKRELTFEEIQNLEKGIGQKLVSLVSGPKKTSRKEMRRKQELRRRLEQMRQTQQAQQQRTVANVPSMVNLDEQNRKFRHSNRPCGSPITSSYRKSLRIFSKQRRFSFSRL